MSVVQCRCGVGFRRLGAQCGPSENVVRIGTVQIEAVLPDEARVGHVEGGKDQLVRQFLKRFPSNRLDNSLKIEVTLS